MTSPLLPILRRDVRLSFARGSEGFAALFFFIVTACLFPFAFGAGAETLQKAAPGILWISGLLSALLSLEAVYHRDFDDGTFDLLMLSPATPFTVALAKILSHWIVTGLPLVAASVPLSFMLSLPSSALPVLLLSLLTGTFYMSLLGGMGAALTLGSRRPGLLLAVLVLPLYIPMLILGLMAAEAALAGLPAQAYLLLQLSLTLAALPLALFVSSFCLKAGARSS